MRRILTSIIIAVFGMIIINAPVSLADKKKAKEDAKWAPAVDPKPLSENAKKGIAWLLKHQQKDGGWAQGEESRNMGSGGAQVKDKPNVGDTCIASLALIRSGSTPSKGPYAKNILSAVGYVCKEIKESDKKSLFVTKIKGTRLQSKLGTYIDTFLASMLLAEVRGKMPDKKSEKMVFDGLHKVMDKIERNQREDGTFGGSGWANALSQSMATKGVNRMAQAGGPVNEQVRERLEKQARSQFDNKSGKFSGKGSAGVDLYSSAGSVGAMQDSANTNVEQEDELQKQVKNAKNAPAKKKAQEKLRRFEQNKKDLQSAQTAVVAKLEDKRFIAGFGSNGGEEFLSYMNIGESLVVEGGDNWKKWDKQITDNLNRIQNKDGSWTGHHCITGRTFCTSAALLVLMTDRAPVPLAAKVKKK